MYRLFVAIEIPEEVKRAAAAVARGVPAARWVPPGQLHLTLRFIGEVDEKIFRAVSEALESVSFSPFQLALRGTGVFPNPKRPRVIWIGMERSAPLFALQRRIESAVVSAGIPGEERPFSPHLTLARLREPTPAETERFLRQTASFAAPVFTVREFQLFSSRLAAGGATHTVEGTYPALAEGGGDAGGE